MAVKVMSSLSLMESGKDAVFFAHSADDLQSLADSLSAATKCFGLTLSIKKTEAMF